MAHCNSERYGEPLALLVYPSLLVGLGSSSYEVQKKSARRRVLEEECSKKSARRRGEDSDGSPK